MPDNVSLSDAAYTTLGAIALQGVRQAAPTLGESIMVIGLGLLGQLLIQLLKANGCRVIGVDINPDAIALAKTHGCDLALSRSEDSLKEQVMAFTNGYGADAVIITASTSSNDPVEFAANIMRDRGRVVMVGVTGMNLPRTPYYMKELEFKLSRSYGAGRYDTHYEEKRHRLPYWLRAMDRKPQHASFFAIACRKEKFHSQISLRISSQLSKVKKPTSSLQVSAKNATLAFSWIMVNFKRNLCTLNVLRRSEMVCQHTQKPIPNALGSLVQAVLPQVT